MPAHIKALFAVALLLIYLFASQVTHTFTTEGFRAGILHFGFVLVTIEMWIRVIFEGSK